MSTSGLVELALSKSFAPKQTPICLILKKGHSTFLLRRRESKYNSANAKITKQKREDNTKAHSDQATY
jgi:hypothetical protein